MAFSSLCSPVYFQELVPLFAYLYERLRRTMGLPPLDRTSLPEIS